MSEGVRNEFWHDKLAKWGLVFGWSCWIATGALLAITWKKMPPQLPLMYSLPAGEDQLITKSGLIVVMAAFGLVFWLDAILAWWIARRESLLRRYLIWGGGVTQLLLSLTIIRILSMIL